METGNFSVSVGELRKALEGIPDDYEVVVTSVDVVDCDIAGLYVESQFPPVLEAPGLVVLAGGQEVTEEYEYYPRLDVALDRVGASVRWDETKQEWKRS